MAVDPRPTAGPWDELDRRLVEIVPSSRQEELEKTEFYAFVHFTVNTFTGREWGDGTESPGLFRPDRLDASQWVRAVSAAGMKGLILTCKHHDGFCLWPSRYTDHTVAASAWKDGKGDVVREVSQACREAGVKFGVYLSPWDRREPCYGSGRKYDNYFVNQLIELLTGYGEIFSVWLDGACGEGPNGKRQSYDWDRYYDTIRRYQPGACIHVCGPDVRWCGNEAGDTRESEWSVVPARTRDTERVAADSQQSDDPAFRERRLKASDRDLGSRDLLREEKDLVWYPAEVNTSIRPGWFYHESEDGKVKPPEELFELYLRSVGGNATLLLNIPPAPNGLFHPKDVEALEELGNLLKKNFSQNLLERAELSAVPQGPRHGIEAVRIDSYEEYFQAPEGERACTITISFPQDTEVSFVRLKENIQKSQRIEKFSLWDEKGSLLFRGTVVGYQKIVRFPVPVRLRKLRLEIEDSRVCPTLSFLGVY